MLPDRIMVLSYPGPDRSVSPADLRKERVISRRYRNRRIGDFLKELELTEGRSTGIPKIHGAMARNGSPPPVLLTDEEHTYFRIELLIHPVFIGMNGVKAEDEAEEAEDEAEEAEDEAGVKLNETELEILQALCDGPQKTKEIMAALGLSSASGALWKAIKRLDGLGLIVLTIPGKPRSGKQQRKLTERGRKVLAKVGGS